MKTYKFKINGNEYDVAINSLEGGVADVTVNGTPYQVELADAPTGQSASGAPGVAGAAGVHGAAGVQGTAGVGVQGVAAVSGGARAAVPAGSGAAAPVATAAPAAGSGKPVTSPLPGVIIGVKVNVGDAVKAGQTVAVLEAMKMENDIQAECDGTVTAVKVAKGDSVLEGAVIVTIA